MKKYKLAVVVSHPIQYQAPLFAALSAHADIDLTVYFCCRQGITEKRDSGFAKSFKWDIPLLDGYRYVFLKNYSFMPGLSFFGLINPAVIFQLRKHNFDAVLVHGWAGFTNWLAFLGSTPVFLRSENPLAHELLKSRVKIALKKNILGTLFRRTGAFLYIGAQNRDFYRFYDVPDEKLFSVPYAVDNARFMRESEAWKGKKADVKASLGIAPQDTVILFCGKLTEKKRPMDLLRAYERLQPAGKSLVFVGDGSLMEDLRAYADAKRLTGVYFTGFKNQSELPRYYALADIFVLPSGAGETWGLVVNEAMCFGLPVLTSELVGCAHELVRNNENGYVFETGNIGQLAGYLEDLCSSPEKRIRFGRESARIVGEYSYQKDIDGIMAALARLPH